MDINTTGRKVVIVLAAALVTTACASKRADERAYRDEVGRAEGSINVAQRAGGSEHDNADMNLARNKLSAARRAFADGDAARARRLAVEARLDAEVAGATASNAETQHAVAELDQSIRALQNQLRDQ